MTTAWVRSRHHRQVRLGLGDAALTGLLGGFALAATGLLALAGREN